MGPKRSYGVALLLTLPLTLPTATLAQIAAPPKDAAADADAQTPSQQVYQLLLKSAPEGVDEDCKAIFAQLGAPPDVAQQIIDHVRTAGPAIVIEGAKDACEQIIAAFDKVGMEAEMRPKPAAGGGAAAQAGAQAAASQAGGAAPKGASASLFEGTNIDLLDAAAFNSRLQSGAPTLVMFFAPWCGHCHKAIPELQKAAAKLGGSVGVAAVDCEASREIAQQQGVQGYPTIKFFGGGGSGSQYNGPRSALALVSFAQNKARLEAVKSGVGKAFSGLKSGLSRLGGVAAA